MKKLIFTALTSLGFVGAFAQVNSNDKPIDNPSPIYSNIKPVYNQKTMSNFNNSGIFGKSGVLGQWFSNEKRLVNDGIPIDNSTGNPSINTYRVSYQFLTNDSFVNYAYYDAQNSVQAVFNPNMHSLGYLFDGRSVNYDPFPGTTSTLTNFTPYTIDSISINFIYERFNHNNALVDTLLFQVLYPNWTTIDTIQNSPFVDNAYIAPSTQGIATIDYDAPNNLAKLRNGTAGNMVTFKIPLTIADSSLADPTGAINVQTKTIKIPNPIQLQRRTRFAVIYKFNPAIPYAVGDTINGDTSAMKLVVKRNNSFRAAIISDYSAFNEADNRVQPMVDRIYNFGLLARTETRYNYTSIFPTGSYFSGRYYSSTFTSSQGLSLNIFPNMAVYVNNVTNAGVNNIKNSNLISSTVYPNPATINGNSSLVFNLKSTSKVSVEIYNLMGQLVKTIANKNFDGGENTVDMNLSGMNAGVYFVNLTVNGISQTKKLTIVQ